ncbi:MAG: hypothetical protein RLZZ602_1311, partial [Pseudomonadota bacterium]
RILEILDIAGGDVISKSLDHRTPRLDKTHHSPWVLEMLLDDAVRLSKELRT